MLTFNIRIQKFPIEMYCCKQLLHLTENKFEPDVQVNEDYIAMGHEKV